MTRLLVLYNQPADPAAFDKYYFATHVPIAQKIPGARAYMVSAAKPATLAGDLSPYLVAEIDFDSPADLQTALASAEGLAAAADLANFAQAGATLLSFDVRGV